ncbi:MAG: DUF748 domain-containing protein [Magnetococcales bacterium]|nr:DUF748 domain-containing protein [Magnetococcales bacterium]
MSNRRSFFLSIFLLVVVFGLAVIVYYQTNNMDWYRPRISDTLQRITGHNVSIKKVKYAPLSGLFTLELKELEILSLDPAEPPMVQVKVTLLSFSPLSIFSGAPQLSSIKLINPQINLVLHDKAPLMERAQDTAVASDKKLLKELGVGLSDITIKRITVQNGILVVLDWDHPEGRTWVFDHLQMGIHALSPTRASPVVASARYRSIPFTVNGQVGPLPDTLDPFAMPILLNFEAKSIRLKELQEILSTDTIAVKTSRGYLTTLLHGSLNEGLQTSTWLQLDGLVLSRKDEKKVVEQPPQTLKNTIIDRLTPKNDNDTLDLAFRQKSVLHMGWYGVPKLDFEEIFIYLDGSPIIEAKGWVKNKWRGPLEMDVKFLNQVELGRLPWPASFPLKGVSPSGTFKLNGTWPTDMSYYADLDLTKTTIEVAPFEKVADTPLAVKASLFQSDEIFTVNDLVLNHPANSNNIIISGSYSPAIQLKAAVNWAIDDVVNYFPDVENWKSGGLMKLDMDIGKLTKSASWQAKGLLQVPDGYLMDLEFKDLQIPFTVKDSQLRFSPLKLRLADGQVDIMGLADLSQNPIIYESQMTITGVDITKLPKFTKPKDIDHNMQFEGYLFAGGTIYGQLDNKTYLPRGSMFGSGHVVIEPGSLRGVDHNAFNGLKTSETVISHENKSLYWNRMESDINLLNGTISLDNIKVDSAQTQISGKGSWNLSGKGQFDLDIKTDFDKKQGYKKNFAVKVTNEGTTSGLKMQAR